MDLLRNLELYELLQLYVVSEVAVTAQPAQLYAILFRSLTPKPLDLEPLRVKYDKLSKNGGEVAFLQPKVIFDLFKVKLDQLKLLIEHQSAKVENTPVMTTEDPTATVLHNPEPRKSLTSPVPFSPPQDSNTSTDTHFFEDFVTQNMLEKYRQELDETVRNQKKALKTSHTCEDIVGPYCGTFQHEEELELHQKLWHSNYVYTACPHGCLMRFLNYNDMKGHRAVCKKEPPKFDAPRTSKKPSRFSPEVIKRPNVRKPQPRPHKPAKEAQKATSSQKSPHKSTQSIPQVEKSPKKSTHSAPRVEKLPQKPSTEPQAKKQIRLKIPDTPDQDDVSLSELAAQALQQLNPKNSSSQPLPKLHISKEKIVPIAKVTIPVKKTVSVPDEPKRPAPTAYNKPVLPKLTLASWERNLHPSSCTCRECTVCTVCNDEFGTKRGMVIHFTRLHRDRIDEPDTLKPPQHKGYRKRPSIEKPATVPLDKVARYFDSSSVKLKVKQEVAIIETESFDCPHFGPWCASFNTDQAMVTIVLEK